VSALYTPNPEYRISWECAELLIKLAGSSGASTANRQRRIGMWIQLRLWSFRFLIRTKLWMWQVLRIRGKKRGRERATTLAGVKRNLHPRLRRSRLRFLRLRAVLCRGCQGKALLLDLHLFQSLTLWKNTINIIIMTTTNTRPSRCYRQRFFSLRLRSGPSPLLVAAVGILIFCLQFPTCDERISRVLVPSRYDPRRNPECA
jgi:hypothetical protein